jgi:Transposase DDE domain
MFTDDRRHEIFRKVREHDVRAFVHLLTPEVFVQAAQRAGLRVGKSALNLTNLVWLGIASAWHANRNFADVLGLTLKLLRDAGTWPASVPQSRTKSTRRSKHDPRGSDPTQVTEEAFVKARKLMPWSFWTGLIMVLVDSFEEQHPDIVRYQKFRLLALDGTCINLDSWHQLSSHFGTAKNGSAPGQTQARMVLLEFPSVRVPLRYELVPLAEGERTVAARLLNGLRRDDLVLIDRGFWSYGLFWQIQNQGAFFGIRLMAGVCLRTLRKLGRNDRLVEWTPSDRQWKKKELPESIQLRVINYQYRGFRPSAVVTNVLDAETITREEWVGLATDQKVGGVLIEGLYHRRWEIETSLKELKVFQGMDGKLRSRTPEGIAYEVAGHIVLYLLIRWLMVEAAKAHDADPLRLSFTGARNELLDMSHALLTSSRQRVATVLLPLLLERIASHRVASRPSRHYPRPHDTQVVNKGKGKQRVPSKLPTATKQG